MLRLKLIKQLKKINKAQKFYLIFFTEKKLCFVLLEVLNNYLLPIQNKNRSRSLMLDGNPQLISKSPEVIYWTSNTRSQNVE